MSEKPYSVKRKEYRLNKEDPTNVDVEFTIVGPTRWPRRFSDATEAQRECDLLNEVYAKGSASAVKQSPPTTV